MADTFTIEEAAGADRIKVVLQDHDMPFGRPRRSDAFELGGPVNREKIYLDGRPEPIIHARQAQEAPIVIRGHLRDRFTGQPGDAYATVKQLERIRHRMRLLKLTWWEMTWTAFMAEAKLPVQGTSDFTYEIHFDILSGPSTEPADNPDRMFGPQAAPADLSAQIRDMLIADRLKMAALFLSRTMLDPLSAAYDALDRALSTVEDAAAAFETAKAVANAESQRLIGKCEETKKRCDDLQTAMDDVTSTDSSSSADGAATGTASALQSSLTSSTAGAEAAYWAWLCQAIINLQTTRDTMRTLQLTARRRINSTTRLYVVADGDTLEKIAIQQLGSASRANDLGLRPADLKTGRVIRIPLAV